MREVKCQECFRTLADITRFVLTLLEHEEITENRTLYTILTSACHLYVIQTKRKTYLCTLLLDHTIWSMVAPWTSCIKFELKLKMDQANERRKRRHEIEQEESKKSTFEKFKSMANSKLKEAFKTKEEKLKEELKENSNLVYDVLSQFITFFINFSLPFSQANKLLTDFCEHYVTDRSKAHSLYTELRSSQRNPEKMFSDEENRVNSIQKRSKRLVLFGYTDITLIVGCCIKFIDEDTTLKHILMLSKDTNDILTQEVLKQALLRSS